MEAKRPTMSFDQALMQELRFGGIAKENLEDLVRIVSGIHDGGLKSMKAFPKGIPPIVDGVRITGVVDAAGIRNFINQILTQTPRLSGVVVFPIGIPWPEIYRVNIDIGNPVEASRLEQF
ncbi:MAG: hypothetical protein ACM3JD_10095 [Rudaea sp.]